MTEALRSGAPSATAAGAVRPARAANLVLRFLLELAAMAALGFWGFRTGDSPAADVLLGAGGPLLAAIVWGTLAAPKSAKRLDGGRLLAVQLTVLGAGAVALIAGGQPLLGAVFAAAIVINAVLLHLWGQDGQPPA